MKQIDVLEQMISAKLRKIVSRELETLEIALDILDIYINEKFLGRPDIADGLKHKDYKELNSNTLCFIVSWALLQEALSRLLAARRLFLCGYISRALASSRDALECVMVADICRNDEEKARKWSRGKQIRPTDKHKYHRILSWKLWEIASDIFNPWGTHSYMQAVVLSSLPKRAIIEPNDAELQYQFKKEVTFVIRRLLLRCCQMLVYIRECYPDAKSNIKGFDKAIKDIWAVTEGELQIPLDELLIKQGKSVI